jgi:hypothetical protein
MNPLLKDIAFRLHIEPSVNADNGASVKSVVKVLSNITKSYRSYVEIEFLRNPNFKKAYEKNAKYLEAIKNDLDLLIVDLNFSSFEAALAPNIMEDTALLFSNEVNDWKRNNFNDYKNNVVLADYNNSDYLREIAKTYTDVERYNIFSPIFASISENDEYKLNVKDNEHKVLKTIIKPEQAKLQIYVSKERKCCKHS